MNIFFAWYKSKQKDKLNQKLELEQSKNFKQKNLNSLLIKFSMHDRAFGRYKQKKVIEYINKMPLQKGTEMYRIELLNILEK